jgi:SAM-dependent methyltransferase
VRFVQADMRDFKLDRQFALAAVGLNSFMHLSQPSDHRRALRCIRDHLLPEGLLILDLFNPDPTVLAEADGRLVYDYTRPGPDPGTVTSRFHSQRVDPAHQTLDVTFFYDEITQQGTLKRTVAPFTMTYFGRHELESLLASADLKLEQMLGGYDLEDFWSGSSKMIAVARRS